MFFLQITTHLIPCCHVTHFPHSRVHVEHQTAQKVLLRWQSELYSVFHSVLPAALWPTDCCAKWTQQHHIVVTVKQIFSEVFFFLASRLYQSIIFIEC